MHLLRNSSHSFLLGMDLFDLLPEVLINDIFLKIACVKELAKCSVVCKRFKQLCNKTEKLDFMCITNRENKESIMVKVLASNPDRHLRGLEAAACLFPPPLFFNAPCLQNLVLLKLLRCTVPSICSGMPHLRTCLLLNVAITDHTLAAFFRLSPSLQYLQFCSHRRRHLEIDCPNLEYLVLGPSANCEITILNSPKLKELCLDTLPSAPVHFSCSPTLAKVAIILGSHEIMNFIPELHFPHLRLDSRSCLPMKMFHLANKLQLVQSLEITDNILGVLEEGDCENLLFASNCLMLTSMRVELRKMNKTLIHKLLQFSSCSPRLRQLDILFQDLDIKYNILQASADMVSFCQLNKDVNITFRQTTLPFPILRLPSKAFQL